MREDQLKRIQRYSRDRAAIKVVLEELCDELKQSEPKRSRNLALVVEDDPMTKLWVRRLLEKDAFAVMTASSAADCMKILEGIRPDIIVLDLMIPDANGDQIFEKIRQIPRTAATPVIFMSGMISLNEEESLNSDRKPLEAYLSKPFDAEKLVELARKLLADSPR